jgi:hypothetical protein
MKTYDPLTDDDYSPFGHQARQQPWGRYVYFNMDEAITNLTDAQWKEYNDMCVALEHYKDKIAECRDGFLIKIKKEVLKTMQAKCHEHLMELVKNYWIETKKRLED